MTDPRRILVLTSGALGARTRARRAWPATASRSSGTPTSATSPIPPGWRIACAAPGASSPAASRTPTDVFASVPELQTVVRFGAGYDAIDVGAATAHGVAVCTIPGSNAEAVADHALALMLSCLHRIPELDRNVRSGAWRPSGLGGDLGGATVGIVGLGAIGRAVARRLSGFGCRLLGADPLVQLVPGVEVLPLDELLPQVDVVTLHAPLVPQTRGLLDARRLALLPAHAIVVNTARGPLIDQAALTAALREGRIAGAALDVFEREPLPRGRPAARAAERRPERPRLLVHPGRRALDGAGRRGAPAGAAGRAAARAALPEPAGLGPLSGGLTSFSAPAPAPSPHSCCRRPRRTRTRSWPPGSTWCRRSGSARSASAARRPGGR